MARAETRFRLAAKRTSPFKSAGASVQSTTGSRSVHISGSNGSNAGYTMFRGSVKSTGYPLHSPVSPSLPLPDVTVCHHISTGLYQRSCGMCCLHIQGTEALGSPKMFVSTSLHEVCPCDQNLGEFVAASDFKISRDVSVHPIILERTGAFV